MSLQIVIEKIEELSFTLTSDIHDDSYSLEVWHSGNCIFVFNINDNRKISMYFGLNLSRYTVDFNLMREIINKSETTLYKEFDEWKASPSRKLL